MPAVPIVYPVALPMPQAAPFQSAERRALAPDGGPYDVRALQRDRLGTQRVIFPAMSAEQTAAFEDWWRVTLVQGGAKFAATWPLPWGTVTWVRRFIGPPHFEFIPTPKGNYWRISADFEVFGQSEEPTLIEASDVVMLLHFDSLPFIDEVGREVTMVGQSDLTIVPGGRFGSYAQWGAGFVAYGYMGNNELMDFGLGPGPTFDIWLRGMPSTDHDNIIFQVAKSVSSGQYGLAALVGSSDLGVARFKVYISATTTGNAWISGAECMNWNGGAPLGALDDFRHVRFGRCSDTLWALAVEGVIVDTYTTAPGLLFNGTVGGVPGSTIVGYAAPSPPFFLGNIWSNAPMDELVARKRWMDSTNFTPPTVRFEYP